jgi:hypothetical protein
MPIRTLFLACLAAGLVACAGTPRSSDEARPVNGADFTGARDWPTLCEHTGTRIPRKPDESLPQPCRAYSGEDIRRTNTTSLEDALRRLDPSIQ